MTLCPAVKNERFGVQRMEMLAIYFTLADNLKDIRRRIAKRRKRPVIIAVRSDSKSSVEQMLGPAQIRDALTRRISAVIGKLLSKIKYTITFDHLERSRNIAGLLIEQKSRTQREPMMDELKVRVAPLCV